MHEHHHGNKLSDGAQEKNFFLLEKTIQVRLPCWAGYFRSLFHELAVHYRLINILIYILIPLNWAAAACVSASMHSSWIESCKQTVASFVLAFISGTDGVASEDEHRRAVASISAMSSLPFLACRCLCSRLLQAQASSRTHEPDSTAPTAALWIRDYFLGNFADRFRREGSSSARHWSRPGLPAIVLDRKPPGFAISWDCVRIPRYWSVCVFLWGPCTHRARRLPLRDVGSGSSLVDVIWMSPWSHTASTWGVAGPSPRPCDHSRLLGPSLPAPSGACGDAWSAPPLPTRLRRMKCRLLLLSCPVVHDGLRN